MPIPTGLNSTRLRDNIISDLYPGYAGMSPADQAKINDAWTKITTRIIDEVKEAIVNGALSNTSLTGTNNPMDNTVTGDVTDGSVGGYLT